MNGSANCSMEIITLPPHIWGRRSKELLTGLCMPCITCIDWINYSLSFIMQVQAHSSRNRPVLMGKNTLDTGACSRWQTWATDLPLLIHCR